MYPSWLTVSSDVTPKVSCSKNVCELNYPCSDSYSCKPYKITLKRGLYHVDVFGAEGGGYSTPGKGGDNGKSAVGSKGIPGSGAFTDKAGENGNKGIFGYGGNATTSNDYEGSGGGGGYYGGNSGKRYCSGGGGGSGYINKNYFKKYKTFTGVRQGHGLIKITFLSSSIINNVVRSVDKIFFLFIVLISSK